jgi:hypothetical protein
MDVSVQSQCVDARRTGTNAQVRTSSSMDGSPGASTSIPLSILSNRSRSRFVRSRSRSCSKTALRFFERRNVFLA